VKIAFLLPANFIGGGLYVAYQHAHYLASRGHNVTVVFLSDAMGTRVTHFPRFSLPVRLLREVVDSGAHFDLVISGWWECCYAMFSIAADHYMHFIQGDDQEVVAQHQGGRAADQLPFIERAFSDPCIGYLVVAKWLKDRHENHADVCVEYAPNGIDTSLFHPSVRPLAPRGERVRLLIEGPGSIPYKRVGMAFRVARRIPEIEIWYVSGDGVVDPAWECHRTFRAVSLQDMPAIYASCDILLKLSVLEGFFGPPLEMMACGGTAVVAKVRGHEEYVVDGNNALAVDLDDEEGAYQALRRLVEDRELLGRLCREGERTAKALDWSNRCPRFEEAVHRLLRRVPPMSRSDRALYPILDALRRKGETLVIIQRELTDARAELADLKQKLLTWSLFRYWTAIRNRVCWLAGAIRQWWGRRLARPWVDGTGAAISDSARPQRTRTQESDSAKPARREVDSERAA
jgi:O-antigen biosynthesis protein